jgi:large subunit ribosomal protein L27
MGRDYTIFAKVDGVVRYERMDKERKQVSVLPQ